MQRLAIVTTDIGQNESFLYLLRDCEKLLQQGISLAVFQENPAPPLGVIPCPVLSLSELWCFEGDVIVNTLPLAEKVLKIPGLHHRFYFCNELEWLGSQVAPAAAIINILANRRLLLVTHSQLYQKILINNFNRTDTIVASKYHFLTDILQSIKAS